MIKCWENLKYLFIYTSIIVGSFYVSKFVIWDPNLDFMDTNWVVNFYLPFGVVAYIGWIETWRLPIFGLPGAILIDWIRYNHDLNTLLLAVIASIFTLCALSVLFWVARTTILKGVSYYRARNVAVLFFVAAMINAMIKGTTLKLGASLTIGYVMGSFNGSLLATFVAWSILKTHDFVSSQASNLKS